MRRSLQVEEYTAFAGTTFQEKRVMITSAVVADEDPKDPGLHLVLSSEYVSLTRQEAISVLHSLISLLTKTPESTIILAGPSSLVLGANPTPETTECLK